MGQEPAGTSERRNRHVVVLGVAVVLLLLSAPLLTVLGALGTVASDACSSSPSLPICSPGNQQLVANLPVGGAVVGLLVALVGGGLAIHYRRTPYPWIALALVLPVVALVIAAQIASTEPRSTESTTAAAGPVAPVPASSRSMTVGSHWTV